MSEKFLVFKGSEVNLEYYLTGKDNLNTIIFVHGVGFNLRQFRYQQEYFSKDFKVLSVSLRGHGKSSLPKCCNYTISKHTKDLIELLNYLEIENAHYVGNSAGGLIGYELIKENPKILKSLVTFGTTAELKLPKFLVNIIVGIDKLMLKINRKGYLKFISNHSSKYKKVKKLAFKNLSLCNSEAIYSFRKIIGNYSYLDVLKQLEIPYLLIQSELDKDINANLKSTLEVINYKNNAQIYELKEAGHLANMDKPNEFNKIIKTFIE